MKQLQHQQRTLCPRLALLLGLVCAYRVCATSLFSVSVASENLGPLGLAAHADAIGTRVAANLASLGYTGESTAGANLAVSLGPLRKDTTPTGFSMSFGDSDPRGGAFQRTSVVDISCQLRRSTEAKVLTRTIALPADPLNRQAVPKLSQAEAIDQIGGVCLSLLEEAQVQPEAVPKSARWKPPVRVEILSESAGPQEQGVRPASANSQAQEAVIQPTGPKKVLIHNQGHPLELEFGYPRR